MDYVKKNLPLLLGIIVGAFLVYGLANITTEKKLSQLQLSLDSTIDEGANEAINLAKLVGDGGLTQGAQKIIADCKEEERNTFESKLSQLDNGLSQAELLEIDVLFSRCAPVRSVRRSLMVMELSKLVDRLNSDISQRKQIGEYTKHDYRISMLNELIPLEEEITELSFDLVYLQREILDALIAGELVNSEVANTLKERGLSTRTTMTEKAKTATVIRSKLIES